MCKDLYCRLGEAGADPTFHNIKCLEGVDWKGGGGSDKIV